MRKNYVGTGEHSHRIAERDWRDGETRCKSNLSTSRFSRISRVSRVTAVGLTEFLSTLLRLEPLDLSRRSIHGDALAVL
jgi:hypothetical protein